MNKALIAGNVLDHCNDGGDFCDGIRIEAMRTKLPMLKVAKIFVEEWGELRQGYDMADFRYLDKHVPAR